MGLDMYLYRRRYVQNWDHYSDDRKTNVTLTRGGKPLELVNPVYIYEQVGYWRKANAIHRWFVTNVQDGEDRCQQSYVTVDLLSRLRETAQLVLNDHSFAQSLLPTTSGFFFGSTDYDEWYFEDLKSTVEIIDKIIEFEDECEKSGDPFSGGDYFYQSSW